MNIDQLIDQQLQDGKMMQLATSLKDQPWCCTVYFVANENKDIYWISKPNRRHSQEIMKNPKASATVPTKFVPGQSIAALQVEGEASLVEDSEEIKIVITSYENRFNRGQEWLEDFLNGNNEHKLYKIVPSLIAVCDEEAFPEELIREWRA